MRIFADDVSIEVPSGWEGAVEPRRPADVAASDEATEGRDRPARDRSGTALPSLHLASVPLPPQRGDFGGGVVSRIGANDVFLAVLLYANADAEARLFQRPLPRSVQGDDLDPRALQRRIPGQSGLQVFCTEAGRALCLYVVAGRRARESRDALRPLNQALASLRVDR